MLHFMIINKYVASDRAARMAVDACIQSQYPCVFMRCNTKKLVSVIKVPIVLHF